MLYKVVDLRCINHLKISKMFKINFIQTANNNKIRLAKSFDTKKNANKYIKSLLNSGKIEKRGYEYFTANRCLELSLNY